MKLRWLKKGIVFLSGCIVFPVAQGASSGSGAVIMNGEITDAACSIAMDSQEQAIDMGVLPVGVIRRVGEGPTRDVDIYLVNCDLVKASDPTQTWKTLRMTFDGPAENGLFHVFGEARGVGLYLQDADQRQVIPGEALPEAAIIPPTMRLSYQLRLVSNNKPLRAGPYQSAIRFKVDYD